MKKLISILMAQTMLLSLSVPAFAADTSKETLTGADDRNTASIPVSGTYFSQMASDEIISVVVAWESMDFTYYGSREGTWNPTSHAYDGEKTAAWNKTKSEITVTNHSNLDVVASLSYEESVDTVTGSLDYDTLNLASAAEGDSLGNVEKAPFATSMFTIGGAMDDTSANALGTITVSLNSKWTTANSYAELLEALKKGGNIKLGADITENDAILQTTSSFNLDLNGKTMTIRQWKVNGTGSVSIYNGAITSTAGDAVNASCSKLTIDHCTLTGSSYYALFLQNGVEAVVRNTTLVNGVDIHGATLNATENVTVNKGTNGIVVTDKNSKVTLCFDPSHVVPADYINNGYIINNGDGTWTVKTQ